MSAEQDTVFVDGTPVPLTECLYHTLDLTGFTAEEALRYHERTMADQISEYRREYEGRALAFRPPPLLAGVHGEYVMIGGEQCRRIIDTHEGRRRSIVDVFAGHS